MVADDGLAIETLTDPASVLAWPGGQPYLSADVAPQDVLHAVRAVRRDSLGAESVDAVAFVRAASGDRDHPWVTALGADEAFPGLVDALIDAFGDLPSGGLIGGMTAPARLQRSLSDHLARRSSPITWGTYRQDGHGQGAPWDWWWTDHVVEPSEGIHKVHWLDADDREVADAIRALLAVASPTHWAPPEHPDVVRWAGITANDGTVLACVAQTLRIPGRPHLASVATHPDHRGQGMGAAVTGWITARLLEEGAPLVSLGMYAHNDVARRVYTRLGYRCDYSWFSSGFASIPASERC